MKKWILAASLAACAGLALDGHAQALAPAADGAATATPIATAPRGLFASADGKGDITPALPEWSIELTYYTDASRRVECGYLIFTCQGGTVRSGCSTRYWTEVRESCRPQ
jgi:hypothetical protein